MRIFFIEIAEEGITDPNIGEKRHCLQIDGLKSEYGAVYDIDNDRDDDRQNHQATQ